MLPRGGREGAKREGGLSGGDLTDMALRGRIVPDQCRIFGPVRDKYVGHCGLACLRTEGVEGGNRAPNICIISE
jgi:hypothetical protein